ncbi:AraC family transcriptional regulator [Roseibacterium sp. SDUM158016]|uniref:AraC family transcriptional regulator n=1 Tax=Roseicyclus sediminis TaxID=2980997 RepID=UPI0021D24E0E|nr:AraC family transcriptional regulator [Roseibacterium sp. SDUM158016]MCU4652773.1 AraC family transcriptional regulator [Roseibacterium sp. SDUM158016]
MSTPTMAAGFAAALLDFAVLRGADRAGLLAACGLTEGALAEQDGRIPLAAYQALIGAAIAATGDSALLLRHTLESRLETMSIVGQIVHSSGSMVHSMAQLNRYARLMADVDTLNGRDRFEVLDRAGEVWIVDHLPVPDSQYIGIEASFARFISEFRRSFPERVFAIEMEVTYPPPPHAAEYPELFRIPVRFGAARNALRIDRSWLDTEFEPGNAYVFGIFTRHADALLEEMERAASVRARVEGRILPRLHEGTLSMDAIARDLGMSRQTLYRRLQDEGVTFAQVHDDLRSRMARDYLSARKVTVGEAAYLLGFSEASSFVRAFRRWTGMSPGEFRDGGG